MKISSRRTAVLVFSGIVALSSFACRKPQVVEKGKFVTMNYTLVVDSNVIDSSTGKQPLGFVVGSGQIIPGLEEQLIGMKIGEKKHVVVAPEKAYGQINPKALEKVPVSAFGNTKGLKPGMTITGNNAGRPVQAKVVSITKKEVTLDTNHPLAGKTLNFDVEIMSVGAPPAAEPTPVPQPTSAPQPTDSAKPQ